MHIVFTPSFRSSALRWLHYTDFLHVLQSLNFTKNKRKPLFLPRFFRFYSFDFQSYFMIYRIYCLFSHLFSYYLLFLSFLFIMFTAKLLFTNNAIHVARLSGIVSGTFFHLFCSFKPRNLLGSGHSPANFQAVLTRFAFSPSLSICTSLLSLVQIAHIQYSTMLSEKVFVNIEKTA